MSKEDVQNVPWRFDEEQQEIFDMLSERIYSSNKNAFAELITNGVTSTILADRKYDTGLEPVFVDIQKNIEEKCIVTIEDSGEGIPFDRIYDMATAGASPTRWELDVMGRFGFGFLSAFRLSMEDEFPMWTVPREEGEEPYEGMWTRKHGFVLAENHDVDLEPAEDIVKGYGTVIQFPYFDEEANVKNKTRQLRKAIENKLQHSRVPITAYINVDYLDTKWDDEIEEKSINKQIKVGGKSIYSSVNENDFSVVIDEDCYELVIAEGVDNSIIQMDRTVHSTYTGARSLIYKRLKDLTGEKPDIYYHSLSGTMRLLDERGIVVDGPHEGLVPVKPREMEKMPEDQSNKFISEDELTEEDIRLPYPSGNREKLDENPKFWEYIVDKVHEQIKDTLVGVLKKIDMADDNTTFAEVLSPQELNALCLCNSVLLDVLRSRDPTAYTVMSTYTKDDLSEVETWDVVKEMDHDKWELLIDFLYAVREEIRNVDDQRRLKSTDLHNIIQEHNEIYMGSVINPRRRDAVKEMDEDNLVLKLPASRGLGINFGSVSEVYEVFEKSLGWKKLKDVDPSESGKSQSGLDPKKREITVHTSSSRYRKMSLVDLRDELEGDGKLNELVLFYQRDRDHNLMSWSHMATKRTGLSTVPKKVYNYFDDMEQVMWIEEKIEKMRNRPIGDGYKIKDLDGNKVVLFYSDEPPLNLLLTEEPTNEDAKKFVENKLQKTNKEFDDDTQFIFAPEEDSRIVRDVVEDPDYVSLYRNDIINFWLWMVLGDWYDNDLVSAISKIRNDSGHYDEQYQLVEALLHAKRMGFDPEEVEYPIEHK